MPKYSFTIARYTLLECIRDRFMYLILIGLLVLSLLSLFVAEIAVTESLESQTALLASSIRLFGVLAIVLFIASSMVRELQDKSFELILAKNISRAQYYLGKLMSCLALSTVIGFLFMLPFIFLTDLNMALAWSFSLACELFIMSCVTLLCVFTWPRVTFVFIAALAFYILARTITTIQLIADSAILESNSLWHDFITGAINLFAYLIPKLNEFTQTAWLIYHSLDISNVIYVLIQTAIYAGILILATLFDLYRKEL